MKILDGYTRQLEFPNNLGRTMNIQQNTSSSNPNFWNSGVSADSELKAQKLVLGKSDWNHRKS